MHNKTVLCALAAVGLMATGPATADQINTASKGGAYHATFCPQIEKELSKSKFKYKCTTSAGTRDNMKRVITNPQHLAFGQLDVLRLETKYMTDKAPFTIVRRDDARECVFAVTRNAKLTTYGDIAGLAYSLKFFLPSQKSGSAGTFQFLFDIDKDGLGQARNVTYAMSVEDALREALSTEDGVAFFVQFSDPENPRFKLVQDLGGHFVPVIDRNILRQRAGGEKIYFAQETEVANAKWAKSGTSVITACTPVVLFTGRNDALTGDAKRDHADMIATLKQLKTSQTLPQKGWFSRMLKKTKALSAKSAEKLLDASEKARERAGPMMKTAREKAKAAYEQAREASGRAVEAGKRAVEKAREGAKSAPAPKPTQ